MPVQDGVYFVLFELLNIDEGKNVLHNVADLFFSVRARESTDFKVTRNRVRMYENDVRQRVMLVQPTQKTVHDRKCLFEPVDLHDDPLSLTKLLVPFGIFTKSKNRPYEFEPSFDPLFVLEFIVILFKRNESHHTRTVWFTFVKQNQRERDNPGVNRNLHSDFFFFRNGRYSQKELTGSNQLLNPFRFFFSETFA